MPSSYKFAVNTCTVPVKPQDPVRMYIYNYAQMVTSVQIMPIISSSSSLRLNRATNVEFTQSLHFTMFAADNIFLGMLL